MKSFEDGDNYIKQFLDAKEKCTVMYNPEEAYTKEQLSFWAEENGFVPEARIKELEDSLLAATRHAGLIDGSTAMDLAENVVFTRDQNRRLEHANDELEAQVERLTRPVSIEEAAKAGRSMTFLERINSCDRDVFNAAIAARAAELKK